MNFLSLKGISKNWLELHNYQIRDLEARFCKHLANMKLTRCAQGRAYECEMQFLAKSPVFRDTLNQVFVKVSHLM
jgi:hypothetical protein